MVLVSELDKFISESIERSVARGYHPTIFIQMRERWGTKEAIKRLVVSGDLQGGFLKLKEMDMLDWTIEAAVLKFPGEFDRGVREAAKFRLDQAKSN